MRQIMLNNRICSDKLCDKYKKKSLMKKEKVLEMRRKIF